MLGNGHFIPVGVFAAFRALSFLLSSVSFIGCSFLPLSRVFPLRLRIVIVLEVYSTLHKYYRARPRPKTELMTGNVWCA